MNSTTFDADRWDADIPLPEARANRPTTFMHKVENSIAQGLLAMLGRMPIEKAAKRMGGLMVGLGPMLRPVQKRGHDNLALIYPDMTQAERAAILRGVWRNLGMTVGEFAHVTELAERTTIIHEERLRHYIENDQKAIFFSAHMGNWEAMPATLFASGLKNAIVYRAANNPIVDAEIIKRRSQAISRRQIPKGKRGARDLVKALNEGLSLCMLTDQKLNDGISVPLLGHPAMTTPAAARLALREDIPFVPIQLVREPGSRFVMTVHEPVSIEKTGDIKVDTETLTAAMNEKIGEFILERPDQWLWLHRRWPKKVAG
ncbi:lysophospholipid acyltransferase family protein [Parvularcula marina]|uniref:Lauroyl acyltransferase n=1 Tax=Parvularcula marina TaxID=2292771 RepID=A0A371REJ1_9PROT|nr:lysophospholipid acyltransferase family protein [Parvularcula marina]RFB03863.1 lauroyl acyltransferase [Parvularcula marina]